MASPRVVRTAISFGFESSQSERPVSSRLYKAVRKFIEWPLEPGVHEMQHGKEHEIIPHRFGHDVIQIPDSISVSVENIVRLEFLNLHKPNVEARTVCGDSLFDS
jgi:hypothetical protein